MSQATLPIRDHLLNLLIDFVDPAEDYAETKEDSRDLVDYLLEAISLEVTAIRSDDEEPTTIFDCTVELVTPSLD